MKQELTPQVIQEHISIILNEILTSNLKSGAFSLILGILSFSIKTEGSSFAVLFVVLFGSALTLLGISMLLKAFSAMRNLKKNARQSFYITLKKCTNKRTNESFTSDGPNYTSYYLHFDDHPEFKLESHIKNQYVREISASALYDSTSIGDTFYLVCMNDSNKIICLFSADDWRLSHTQFTVDQDKYIPIQ